MAAELRHEFPGADVTLIPSGGGRFEVTCDATPVFRKSEIGRHARPGEVVTAIRARAATPGT